MSNVNCFLFYLQINNLFSIMKKYSFILLFIVVSISSALFAQSVGSTDGVFNVSDMGAANYSIPIKVSPAPGGMQPNLAVSYSSQGGNSIMGMGWSLSGLSAITRIGNNIYNDSKVAGTTLTTSDKFALDGQRLIVTNGTYGAAASTYSTEVESFREITANGSYNGGPASFTVKDQGGRTYTYGASYDSRVALTGATGTVAWLLYQVTDLLGNAMQYTYEQLPGQEPRLSNISYSLNTNFPGSVASNVSFSYESKADSNFSYLAGGKLTQSYRLKSITVKQMDATGDTKIVGSYAFSYNTVSSTDPVTKLIKITEKGSEVNGTPEVLPSTEFTYGEVKDPYQSLIAFNPANEDMEIVSGDYNGDGRVDIIKYTKNYNSSSNNWRLHYSVGAGFSSAQVGSLPAVPNLYIENKNIINRDYRSSFFDFNGDGKDDFVYRTKAPISNGTTVEKNLYTIMLSTGSSLVSLEQGRTILPSNNDDYIGGFEFWNTYPLIGDFDGDGKSEILVLKGSNDYTSSGSANYMIGENYLKSYGSSYLLAKQLQGMPFDGSYTGSGGSKLYVVDVDGDGKSEVLSLWKENNVEHAQSFKLNVSFDANNKPIIGNPAFIAINDAHFPTLTHEAYLGDFNGDGITDYLTYKSGENWKVAYGKGDGSVIIQPGPNMHVPLIVNNIQRRAVIVGDFNGDGKSDIFDYNNSVMWGGSQQEPRIFYSIGNNSFQAETNLMAGSLLAGSMNNYWLADYSGDGSTDMLACRIQSQDPLRMFSFHSNETRQQLSKVKNGFGSETKINYLFLSNSSVYTSGSNTYNYPFIKRTIPFKVVASIFTDNGVSAVGNKIDYTYSGLKFHALGKGLMGFDKVTSYDQVTQAGNEKSFGLNTSYAYPYLESAVTKYNNSEVLSTASATYGVYHYGNKRIFPYQITSQQDNNLTGETVSTTNNYSFPAGQFIPYGVTYSSHIGKPFSITTNKGAGLEISTQTFIYPNYADGSGGSWTNPVHVFSKPSAVTTTTTRQYQPAYSRTATFVYSAATGLLAQSVLDPATANTVTTAFEYDVYGNPTRKLVTASGLPEAENS